MSVQSSLVTLAAIVITAFVLIGQIFLGSRGAFADDPKWETRTFPSPATTEPVPAPELDAKDEVATLERIQYALSEIGDGSTYVWRRWHGRLSGVIHPTTSFKDRSGKVCRHIVILLTTGQRTARKEGIACRLASGRWQLDG
jgi:hypothetical protein